MNNKIAIREDFTQNVKRLVNIDTQLKMINEKTKQLRE